MSCLFKTFRNNFAYISVTIIGAIILAIVFNSFNPISFMILLFTISMASYITLLIKRNRVKKSLISQNPDKIDTTHYDYDSSGYNLSINSKFQVEYFSKSFLEDYNLQGTSILGKNIFELLHIDSSKLLKTFEDKDRFKGIVESKDKDTGEKKHHSIVCEPIANISALAYHCTIHDISNSLDFNKTLKEKFLIDKLTKLSNKTKLLGDIEDILAKSTLKTTTLIYISIDTFDEIYEYFGIDIGNKVLSRVGTWLSKNLPTNESKLYKLDLENFAILNTDKTNFGKLETYLKKISSDIQKEVFSLKGTNLNISFTMGATRCKTDMVKCAYLALKNAKHIKRSYKIYDNGCRHEEQFSKNIQMVQMIKNAIVEDRVVPFFQPIYNIKTGKIEKYETLIRIKDKDDTYIRPADFLELAQKSKLYLDLSRTMIKNSFDQLEELNFPITINLTLEDMEDYNQASFIIRRLVRNQLSKLVTFEIVESQRVINSIKVTNFIKKVRMMGAAVAIDDFGSGYSNYEQLRHLEVDYLKIDGSLIKDIVTDKQSEIFTKSIVEVAQALNMKTVAEFVSSKEILEKITELGIDYAQGYHIGKPAITLLPVSIND